MKVGIIQSNFIPWRGYFDFIDDVDLFVFYDDVQYTHRDWRNRNRIKTCDGAEWLSVPVIHDSTTLVENARVDYTGRWVEKHIRTMSFAYAKAPHFAALSEEYFTILRERRTTISELNIALCKWVMQKLAITTRTLKSSEIGIRGDKYQRPLLLLERLGATSYLSGPSARAYTDPDLYRSRGIALEFKRYEYAEYPQLHGPFVPDVSVLDLLFNCGPDSRNYLKSLQPNEVVAPSASRP